MNQQILLLTTTIKSVPEPILCKSCLANQVGERGRLCTVCIQMKANIAKVENDRSFKRIALLGGAVATGILVYFAAVVIQEAFR